jgi:tetratricopeptide (TPR) repeat protein
MIKVKKTQLILVVAAVVLFVLLYFVPKHSPDNSEKETLTGSKEDHSETIESFVNSSKSNLTAEQKTLAEQKNLDSVIAFWDKNKRPDIASFYFEKKVIANKGPVLDWFKAGDRYYYSVRFIKDPSEQPVLYTSAIRCYENGLKLDPNNTEAKIMLASCFVEGSADPMKGISMLREIEKTDSNNVTLQMNFALFSVRSQQWDRAIKRFEKVIRLDTNYVEAYLYLANAYEQSGQISKTIEMLEKAKSRTDDPMAKEEMEKYIQELKTKN